MKTNPLLNNKKNDAKLDAFLNTVQKSEKSTAVNSKSKVQSINLFEEDMAKLKELKVFLINEVDNVNTSKLFRAALHLAQADDSFLEVYNSLK